MIKYRITALLLFATSFITWFVAFPLSVYIGEGTVDPDFYEFLGAFGGLFLMFLSLVLGSISTGIWLFKKNLESKKVEDYNFDLSF